MKLEYIQLKDFRQYYGEQEAEFSLVDDLNVTVFHAQLNMQFTLHYASAE